MLNRRVYDRQFKLEALRLWQSTGKSAAEVEADLGITSGMLYQWQRQYKAKGSAAFPGHGQLPEGDDELQRLRRENEILRQERDILKKAVAIFSHTSK